MKERKLVQVSANEVELGMFVSQLDRPWTETPFMFQGFLLTKREDLQVIKDTCSYVFVDVLKTTSESRARLIPPKQTGRNPRYGQITYQVKHEFEKEIPLASREYHATLKDVKELLTHVRFHAPVELGAVRDQVNACVDSVERNPAATAWLSRIKHVDEYTAEHCLNVGLLAAGLGRHLGLKRKQLENLALCGILHDVGKMLVDQELLNKPGPLTPEEFNEVKMHTVRSAELLGRDNSIPREAKYAALHHHERIDGAGYPRGIRGERISFYTKVISIVDAFDAITSERCYSSAKSPAEALKIIYENRSKQFDEELSIKFIEFMGLYPPGSIVEMSTKEVGVVLSSDPKHRLHPRVLIVLNANKEPTEHRVVDLKNRDAVDRMGIKASLDDKAYGIDIEKISQSMAKNSSADAA